MSSTITGPIGGELQGWAAVLEQKAMNEALKKELGHQQAYREQGMKSLGGYLPSLSAENTRSMLDTSANERLGQYGQYNASNLAVGAAPFSTEDSARLGLEGQARARLGSYNDVSNLQDIQASEEQNQLNRIFAKAGGRASVFPWKMASAQHSQDALNAAGQMIASMGGTGTNFSSSSPSMTGQGPNIGSMDDAGNWTDASQTGGANNSVSWIY